MNAYLSVFSPSAYEKVIERSRFIANCAHAESEEEARAFIAKVRAEHSLATHNCFAFIADKAGNLMRFSDDGEPQGTAGMPILDVLKNKKLTETAVAVVRYFGGIKLGAGGLVRAYSSAASENLAGADIRTVEMCREYEIRVDYSEADSARKFISSGRCLPLSENYAEKVFFTVAVKKSDAESFQAEFIDYMQGRGEIKPGREYYRAFGL